MKIESKEQFKDLWNMYKIACQIDTAWRDYYNYRSELFGGPGNGCDDYRDIDPTDESYLTNLMKKAKNMEEYFQNEFKMSYKEYRKQHPSENIKNVGQDIIKDLEYMNYNTSDMKYYKALIKQKGSENVLRYKWH